MATNSLRPIQAPPILFVDIDGVISLFGFAPDAAPAGSFHTIDGMAHFLSAAAGEHLLRLAHSFELVWCSGWEDRANDYLPHLLGLPGPLPFLRFERSPSHGQAHWKLDAIDRFAGQRALAWIDDALDDACRAWAARRAAPTLLVPTLSATGITGRDVRRLLDWAEGLPAPPPRRR